MLHIKHISTLMAEVNSKQLEYFYYPFIETILEHGLIAWRTAATAHPKHFKMAAFNHSKERDAFIHCHPQI